MKICFVVELILTVSLPALSSCHHFFFIPMLKQVLNKVSDIFRKSSSFLISPSNNEESEEKPKETRRRRTHIASDNTEKPLTDINNISESTSANISLITPRRIRRRSSLPMEETTSENASHQEDDSIRKQIKTQPDTDVKQEVKDKPDAPIGMICFAFFKLQDLE